MCYKMISVTTRNNKRVINTEKKDFFVYLCTLSLSIIGWKSRPMKQLESCKFVGTKFYLINIGF